LKVRRCQDAAFALPSDGLGPILEIGSGTYGNADRGIDLVRHTGHKTSERCQLLRFHEMAASLFEVVQGLDELALRKFAALVRKYDPPCPDGDYERCRDIQTDKNVREIEVCWRRSDVEQAIRKQKDRTHRGGCYAEQAKEPAQAAPEIGLESKHVGGSNFRIQGLARSSALAGIVTVVVKSAAQRANRTLVERTLGHVARLIVQFANAALNQRGARGTAVLGISPCDVVLATGCKADCNGAGERRAQSNEGGPGAADLAKHASVGADR
jgi:hypothetical protein